MVEVSQANTKRTQLVWTLTLLLLMLMFGGTVFQYVNYRVVKVVDEYEMMQRKFSRSHPSSPLLQSQNEYESAVQERIRRLRRLKRLKSIDSGYADDNTLFKYSVLKPKTQDFLLEAEVIAWNAPENNRYQLGRKAVRIGELRQVKSRRMKVLRNQNALHDAESSSIKTTTLSEDSNLQVLQEPPSWSKSKLTTMPMPDDFITQEAVIASRSMPSSDGLQAPTRKSVDDSESLFPSRLSSSPDPKETNTPGSTGPELKTTLPTMEQSEAPIMQKTDFELKTTIAAVPLFHSTLKTKDVPPKLSEEAGNAITITEPNTIESWLLPSLLDIPNFVWLMNNKSICNIQPILNSDSTVTFSTSSQRFVSILVHSARQNFMARRVLRQTWGSLQSYKNWQIRLVFLLGQADRNAIKSESLIQKQKKRLQQEQAKHGDLVMGNFVDSKRNVTYKHLMGYKWILNFCQNANFVIKVEDTVFLNFDNWLDWLDTELNEAKSNSTVSDLYCKVQVNKKPVREGKWKVTLEEWPVATYPTYCHGWAYGASITAVQKLYSASSISNFFWIDDIYVTGVLRSVSKQVFGWKPKIKDISNFVSLESSQIEDSDNENICGDKWSYYFATYLNQDANFEKNMMCLWNQVLKVRKNSSTNEIVEGRTEQNKIMEEADMY